MLWITLLFIAKNAVFMWQFASVFVDKHALYPVVWKKDQI
jgi:hypothetical protein